MQLRLATDAEKVARDRVTFPEWGTRLSLEQYLEREAVLRAHPFSRGMRTWLLLEGADVLASCETFDNVSCVGADPGVTWSIASVYVEERHRGRGHATKLMDLVAEEASRQGVQACVLFSDVGTRIYERSGFVAVEPAEDWVMSPLASAPAPLPPHPGPLPLRGERGLGSCASAHSHR
jgi:predicted N-acetyltransferase YhbS